MTSSPTPSVLFESCVDTLEAAVASAAGGAGRIELCANLDVGGTTPDAALVGRCVAAVDVSVFVMTRPRGGDFVYDTGEAESMLRDVALMKSAGAHGIVCGALTRDGDIDTPLMARLIDAARPLPVTYHKAFDDARDLPVALEALCALGVDRVLTSGGAATATGGAAMLARLVAQAAGRLTILAGGGVRAHNVADLVRATRVREVHAKLLGVNGESALLADVMRHTVADFVQKLSGIQPT